MQRSLRTRGTARALFALVTIVFAAGTAMNLATHPTSSSQSWGSGGVLAAMMFSVALFSFPVAGLLLASRRPDNWLGWTLLATGMVWAQTSFDSGYATLGLITHPGSLPDAAYVAALDSWLWVPAIALMGVWTILMFPDGRLPSAKWRRFCWIVSGFLAAAALSIVLFPGKMVDGGYPNTTNPLGVQAIKGVLDPLRLTLFALPVAIVVAAVNLVKRYRRSSGLLRLQLKWLASAAAVIAVIYLIAMVLSVTIAPNSQDVPAWLGLFQNVALISFGLIPTAIVFAVLKHQLYDIDLVINKTLVYASLAVFITAVYVGVVVGVGALAGGAGGPVLSAIAAAIVATAFQPARRRAQHLADRLVYGKRATPYEVLSAFSDRLAGAYANEDLMPRMARILAEGTGAERADVWLRTGDLLSPAATWPEHASPAEPVAPAALPAGLIPVRHQGELLGALSIEKKPGESIGPTEEKLVADLASQAGLVLRNVSLIEDLKASRMRLVAAQDEERRKLERNLHDGAQQQLVALSVKARLARSLASKDPAKAEEMLDGLQTDLTDALETLRDLARGIYPQLLADKGLGTALESQARKAAVPVEVDSNGVGRYSQDVEAAVYFCILEALNNIAKYAEASRADVTLAATDGVLTFTVSDDGKGFDTDSTSYGTGLQGIADRLAALGGEITIRSTPNAGTTVTGTVPDGVTL